MITTSFPDDCAAGAAALSRAAWPEARAAFDASLAARESPEALEGLGLAAWWLDLADVMFDARSHPTDENVVITSGALTFGMGDKLAKGAKANQTLLPGGYALMPANMNHFAYTGAQPATIVLYGMGPVEFKYVNPADDPRNQKK